MSEQLLNIADLAEQAGISARAVRFYVQQRLLPAPLGRGRGNHYTAHHLETLRRILDLQSKGHSLDAIRHILNNEPAGDPAAEPTVRPRPVLHAQLWTRLRLADGVELQYDATRYNPEIEALLSLRETARSIFKTVRDGHAEETD